MVFYEVMYLPIEMINVLVEWWAEGQDGSCSLAALQRHRIRRCGMVSREGG